ncbi:helix-turn-helix domain-containing protein [Spirosoma sp. HMF4905]|uniref:Helix-turn-helix domain-containing protein n=1 Tax=Spirosoma arboris TaxID=2682092 RepID=A0A7K1S3Q8_9BACT|nr:helix-turn-helix domain-containing protein [Spirosoma arboris]MVM28457.1 helix-turn-helix domain-containing protein [Spirosoma arboris]
MVNRIYAPHPALASFIKGYQIVHIQRPAGAPIVAHPFPPHAVQNLSFYPRDSMDVFYHRTGQTITAPDCISIGPYISRVDLMMGKDHLIVATFFEPGGLHRLLGIPMAECFDFPLDVSLLWNAEIRRVNEQLRETTDYDQMQQIVEAFLLRQYRKKQIVTHPIDKTFQFLSDPTRLVSLDYLADQACLSFRQFERKCHERLGLGPKTFRRLARFSKAFRLKEQRPDLDWLDIALHHNYYDLQHMRRDFKEFAGVTPTLLLEEETRSLIRPYSSHSF